MTGFEIMAIAYTIRWLAKKASGSSSTSYSSYTPSPPPPPEYPKKIVTLVGRTSAGKSSTGNAILEREGFGTGVEHGTTTTVSEVNHHEGYVLRDTPGILDGINYKAAIWSAIEGSELVVYVTPGQLYRQELEFIEGIRNDQRSWDARNSTPDRRKLILFVNFGDVKRATMPRSERQRETDAIHTQVAAWIAPEHVVFGAAAPFAGGRIAPPDVHDLKTLINRQFGSW